jgi:hypothetical protein
MSFSDLTLAAQQYFPHLQIKYKNQSALMKFLGNFLGKSFMNEHATIFCNTIYIPNQNFTKIHSVSAAVAFMHELVRTRNSRTKAYLSSLYVIWKLSQRMRFTPHLEREAKNFTQQLEGFWLPAPMLEEQFEIAIQKIILGQRPYEDPIFDILDDLVTKF